MKDFSGILSILLVVLVIFFLHNQVFTINEDDVVRLSRPEIHYNLDDDISEETSFATPIDVVWYLEKDWRELIVKKNKPAFMFFTGDNCLPCNKLKKILFKDPEIIDLLNQFVCINIEGERVLSWKVDRVPYSVFINTDGEVVSYDVTPATKERLIEHLNNGYKLSKGE